MKNIIRLLKVISFLTIITFSLTACDIDEVGAILGTASLRVNNNHADILNSIEIWTANPTDLGMNPQKIYERDYLLINTGGERTLTGIPVGNDLYIRANGVVGCFATFTAGGTVTVTRLSSGGLNRH